LGEGPRMVRDVFRMAKENAPSIVFIDEVDSLLCQRSSDENEASRRLKTEFMTQIDGATTASSDRILGIYYYYYYYYYYLLPLLLL
jgi:ATP-dependent 26S proteasome regulatory subunit